MKQNQKDAVIEAVANADAHMSNVAMPTYSELVTRFLELANAAPHLLWSRPEIASVASKLTEAIEESEVLL